MHSLTRVANYFITLDAKARRLVANTAATAERTVQDVTQVKQEVENMPFSDVRACTKRDVSKRLPMQGNYLRFR